jgi:hypothetical protein
MVDQILFDKLTYIDRLKRAGIDEGQARAHAEAMDEALRESVATKSDIAAVRADIKSEIAAVRTDVAAVRTDLEHKLEIAVRDMTIRMGGIAVVQFGALAAIKLFG